MEDMEKFLEQCEKLNDKIIKLSSNLNEDDPSRLRIDDDVKVIVDELKQMNESKKKMEISDEQRNLLDKSFDSLKENFVALKNKHITRYNTIVYYINELLFEAIFDEELKEIVVGMSKLPGAEKYVNGDWQDKNYTQALNYDELEEYYKTLSGIKDKIITFYTDRDHSDVPENLYSRYFYSCELLNNLEKDLEKATTPEEITLLSNRIVTFYDGLVDLNVVHALDRDKLNEIKFSQWSHKVVELHSRYIKLEDRVMEKKFINGDDYNIVDDYLNLIEKKYNLLNNKIYEYDNKCNGRALLSLEHFSKTLKEDLDVIDSFVKDKLSESLNKTQIDNLNKKIEKLNEINSNINSKLNRVLNSDEVLSFYSSKMDDLDKKLTKLNAMVTILDTPIKNRDKVKSINGLIKDRKKDLKKLKDDIEFYKDKEPEKYNTLKDRYDEMKSKFDDTCKEYNGKRPLKVVSVKNAKNLYKKYKKPALFIAGLAGMALLYATIGSIIIPAIMHGNIMIGAKAPALRGFVNFVNNVLGNMINATCNKYGVWSLANGVMINPNVASTSLLKGLAISGVGTATLVTPVIIGIKKVVEKMKKFELKKKNIEEVKNNVKKKVSKKVTNKTGEKKKVEKLAELIVNYNVENAKSGMSIDDYCSLNNIDETKKYFLEQYYINLNKNSGRGK